MTARSRVALVTGAARGIGAATVLRLATDGWAVLAVDVCADDPALGYRLATRAELDAIVARASASGDDAGPGTGVARARGPRVSGLVADVRDEHAMEKAVAEAERRFGGLDAVIAAAGVIAGGGPAWEADAAAQQVVIDVNLGGVLALARAAVPALLRRPEPRSGRFIAVTSAAATRGLPMLAAYCASKAGVAGLVRALAAELGSTGVTANAVSPGSTDTAMLAESTRLYGLASPQSFAAQQPAGRLLSPGEVAAALAWLASEESSGVTGAVLPVDGGLAL